MFWRILGELRSQNMFKYTCTQNFLSYFSGHPDTKSFFGRYIGWNSSKHLERCKAKHYVHNVCVFGVEDLPAIKLRSEIIANKFDIEYDPIAYKCMEEWVHNKTLKQEPIHNEHLYKKIASVT